MADNNVEVEMEFVWDDPQNTQLRASVNKLFASEGMFTYKVKWAIVDGTVMLKLTLPESKLAEMIGSLHA